MNQDATKIAGAIMKQMEEAWNRGDGMGFAAPFAEDADFVDIRGDHHRGRQAIGFGHQAIMDSVYKGSVNQYTLESARQPADGVIVAHIGGLLKAPSGPLAGENRALMSMVLTRKGESWEIAAFQNTLRAPEEVRQQYPAST